VKPVFTQTSSQTTLFSVAIRRWQGRKLAASRTQMTNHPLRPQTQTRTLLNPNRANRSDRIEFLEAQRRASLDFSFATIPLAGWQSALCTGLGTGWVSARPKSQARARRRAVVLILTSFLSLTRQHLSSAHTGIASSVSTYTFGLLPGKAHH
jgi:hypothetical protein